jgi:two-component system LytT family response regulator
VKTLVVDDERPARERLKRLLAKDPRIELLGEAADGETAIEQIETLQPELVFLDIQMPGMTGFDVLRLVQQTDLPPKVIFVTAHDEYAVKAFELAATDYLLKPYSEERLAQAIDRVIEQPPQDSEIILEQLQTDSYVARLPVRFMNRIRLLDVSRIAYITSEHRVNQVYTTDGERHWTPEALDQLARRLDPSQFFRIHRSSLINLSAEFEIEPWEDGRLKIRFESGALLTAARGPAQELRERFSF